jgi:peptide/nickel transport system substrate-binding protein
LARLRATAAVPLLLLSACAEPERPFVLGLGSAPTSLDPHLSNESAAFAVNSNLYDTLVTTDAALAIRPSLALRWLNPDELSWSFELRQGVMFHDGTRLEADDVVASLTRARDDPRSEFRSGLQDLDEIQAPGPGQLRITTRRPFPTLLRYLVAIAIVPRERLASSTPLGRDPVGSGPFRFISRDAPTGPIVLQRFDGYWGDKPSLDRALILAVSDERERLRALAGGSVDLIADVPAASVEQLRNTPSLRVLRAAGLRESYVLFDMARGKTPYASPPRNPFLDRRVRVAFVQAIDRGRLVREVLQGFGQEATQFAAPGVFGFNPSVRPPAFDPQQARLLLEEAGGGFSVTLDAPQGVHPGDARAAEAVARNLRAIGVDVRLNLLPKAEIFDKLTRRDTSLAIGSWNCLSGDMEEIYLSLLRTPRVELGQGVDNTGGYSNPAVDAAFALAGATAAPEARLDRLQKAVALASADVPWVPLYVQDQLYGIRDPYDWTPRPDKRVRLSEVTRR